MGNIKLAPHRTVQLRVERMLNLPGDAAKAKIYVGPVLFSDNAASVPVTGEFHNVNGTVEMLVHIQDKILLYVSDGSQFKLKA